MDTMDYLANITVNGSECMDGCRRQTPGGIDITNLIEPFFIPVIGIFGVFGNTLNLVVLWWRDGKRQDDRLEKVAFVGLSALALSDLCFCLLIVPPLIDGHDSITSENKHGFWVYYNMYGNYLKNVFIKTSTWLTMIVAAARYLGIVHPFSARVSISLKTTRIAVTFTFFLWFVLTSPLLFTFEQHEYHPNNSTILYVLDSGPYLKYPILRLLTTYVWAILGFFVPLAVLGYCNCALISTLRKADELRLDMVAGNRTVYRTSSRITVTLIALVLMCLILVFPSEGVHFIKDISVDRLENYKTAIIYTNLLQAINFAFHFVLYCVVNATFRRTLCSLARAAISIVRPNRFRRHSFRDSLSRRSFYTPHHSIGRSHETTL